MRLFNKQKKPGVVSYKARHICSLCGKMFIVEVRRKDGTFLTTCYHSIISENYFMGWVYTLPKKRSGKYDFSAFGTNRQLIIFKNTFYKIIGYTKIQREIVYWVWTKIWKPRRIDYWECPKCIEEDNPEHEGYTKNFRRT